jgi:hypothetical protein
MTYKKLIPLIKVVGLAVVTLVIVTSIIEAISRGEARTSKELIVGLAFGPIVFGGLLLFLENVKKQNDDELDGLLFDVIFSVFRVTLLGINTGLVFAELYILVQWNNNPQDSRFEPLFSLIAFVVVIAEYLRQRSNADRELDDDDEPEQAPAA